MGFRGLGRRCIAAHRVAVALHGHLGGGGLLRVQVAVLVALAGGEANTMSSGISERARRPSWFLSMLLKAAAVSPPAACCAGANGVAAVPYGTSASALPAVTSDLWVFTVHLSVQPCGRAPSGARPATVRGNGCSAARAALRAVQATPYGRLGEPTTRAPTSSPRMKASAASITSGASSTRRWPRPSVVYRRAPGQSRA